MAVKVTREVVQQGKDRLSARHASVKSAFAKLENLVSQVTKGAIQGSAATAILDAYATVKPIMERADKELTGKEESLNKALVNYDNTTDELNATINKNMF